MPCERKHLEAIKRAHGRVHFYQSMNVPCAIEDLTAAISAALAACDDSQWRGMDSAPKDGTYLLMLVDGYHDIGRWFDASGGGGWWVCHCMPINPTHWMPLPVAPEVK